MKRKSLCIQFTCLCAFLIVSPCTFAVLYVDAMSLDVGDSFYFDVSSGQFNILTPAGGSDVAVDLGDIHIFGGGYDYGFEGTISVTASTTTGTGVYLGDAYADFSSGATLTVTTTAVKEKATGTIVMEDSGNDIILLEAQITADWWYLTETATADKLISVGLTYAVTGGELFDGDLFKMYDFGAVWSFPETSGTPFSTDLSAENPSLLITSVVPEPATMMLLLAGGLLIRNKK